MSLDAFDRTPAVNMQIAGTVANLAAPAAAHVTGIALSADGGLLT
jgi:hypothetical protein